MRIIHTSDVHLLSPLTSVLPEDKARTRRGEIISTFRRMTEEAVRLDARIFIIAGDLFDSERISGLGASAIIDAISRTPSVTYLYLPGNHEGNALSRLGISLPRNLKIFGKCWTSFDFDDLTVFGRSENVEGMFSSLVTDGKRKNIAVLHGEAADKSTTNAVGFKEAENLGLDYIAMGHYHSYSVHNVDRRCKAVYCGTPEGRGFDEAHPCGFVLIDTDGIGVSHRFIPFAKREIRIIRVDISDLVSTRLVEDEISRALGKVLANDIVRLVITGKRAEGIKIVCRVIAERYEGQFFHLEVIDDTRAYIDYSSYKNDKTLKGEFIRLVNATEGLSDGDKDRIIKTGLSALLRELDEI